MLEAKPVAQGEWLIAAPAHPRPPAQVDAIAAMLADIGQVQEAHLPLCSAPGVTDGSRQVLVVVLEPGSDVRTVMQAIDGGLQKVLGTADSLDMMQLPEESDLLRAVRGVGMRIHGGPAERTGFWKRLFG
jgi:hypothetical protein